MTEKHRWAAILDAVTYQFSNHLLIKERVDATGARVDQRTRFAADNGFDNFDEDPDPEFPIHIKTLQKRYIHWTTLDSQGAIPALLLNYGTGRRKTPGGTTTEFASLGEIEEAFPLAVIAVLKEDIAQTPPYPITDQVSDMIYTVERIVNGMHDLGIEGVCKVHVESDESSEGKISALEGTPFEVIIFRVIVTHIYDAKLFGLAGFCSRTPNRTLPFGSR